MKVLRVLIIVFILGASAGGFWLLATSGDEPPKRPPVAAAILVDTFPLELVNVEFSINSQGTVQPEIQTELSSEISGTITSISPKFTAGGVFKAGEVLMRIDPTNYEVAVAQAEAILEQRQIEFEGAGKLRSQGFRAESEFAQAKAALATARAELVRANRNLERTYIRLPYDGIVRSKLADLGQFVNPGTRLGVTFATGTALVRLPLSERDLAFVDLPRVGDESQSGAPITLSTPIAGQVETFGARIVRTEGVVDENSRVTYAVARIDDPYGLESGAIPLPIGSFVGAAIPARSKQDVLRVPRYALRGSDQLMFRDEESTLRIRTVDVIRADSDWAYLSGGAFAGEEVITTTLESPVNGIKLRTLKDASKLAESAE